MDVPDTLLRHVDKDAVGLSQAPMENIDTYSGNLSLIQTDLSLPQKGDLSLTINRVYNSKVWGRRDFEKLDSELFCHPANPNRDDRCDCDGGGFYPWRLLNEAQHNFLGFKENSPLGIGWSLSLGTVRNPFGQGGDNTACNDSVPLFDNGAGRTESFYCTDDWIPPVPGTSQSRCEDPTQTIPNNLGKRQSASGSRYYPRCPGLSNAACIQMNGGITYEFASDNAYCYGNNRQVWCPEVGENSENRVLPVSRIRDAHGNTIDITYVEEASGYPTSGVIDTITDSYGRTIEFETGDKWHTCLEWKEFWYDAMVVKDQGGTEVARVSYDYDSRRVNGHDKYNDFFNLLFHRFLTKVTLPGEGNPTWAYDYVDELTHDVDTNVGALSKITYPAGGVVEYDYQETEFMTGLVYNPGPSYPTAQLMPVTERRESGYQITPSTTTYTYLSNEVDGHETTLLRPDGHSDVYTFHSYVGNGNGNQWKVGLLDQVSGADGARLVTYDWLPVETFEPARYGQDWEGNNETCNQQRASDDHIYVARLARKKTTTVDVIQPTMQQVSVTSVAEYCEYAAGLLVQCDLRPDGSPRFTPYGEPRMVVEYTESEPGLKQVTKRDFFIKDDAAPFFVRGKVAEQETCIAADCMVTHSVYDAMNGNLLEQWPLHDAHIDPLDHAPLATTFTYYPVGHPTEPAGAIHTVTDAENRTVTLSGYDNGLATNVDLNGVLQMQRTATWRGQKQSETVGGSTTSFTYDELGRVVTTTPPIGARVRHHLCLANRVFTTKEVLIGGQWTPTASYDDVRKDGFGRTIDVSNSEGECSITQYDTMGRLSFQSYSQDAVAEYQSSVCGSSETYGVFVCDSFLEGETTEYDALGRVVKAIHGDATYSEVSYEGLEVVTRNEAGNEWRSVSDGLGRLISVSDPSCATSQYEYDVAGNLTRVDEPGQAADRVYVYDPRNMLTQEFNPETGDIVYTSDNVGNVLTRSDLLHTATFTYDDLGRLETVDHFGSLNDATYTHDPDRGWLNTVTTNEGGFFEFVRDDIGRITERRWLSPWFYLHTTGYVYDDESLDSPGCMTSLTYPTGRVVEMTCDSLGRPSTVDGFVSQVDYSSLQDVVTLANGRVTTVTLDNDSRRTQSIDIGGISNFTFGYDLVGNITGLTDTQPTQTIVKTMTYDPLNRLETANGPWGLASYGYDCAGNREFKEIASGPRTDYFYEQATGRLDYATGAEASDYTFDAIGQMQSGDGNSYTWNALGMLKYASAGLLYGYDTNLRTVSRREIGGEIVMYHYDESGRKLAETAQDGTPIRDYIYLGGQLVAIDGETNAVAPVACYDFDDNTDDSSGYDNHGLVTGDVDCTAAGKFGQACSFNGGFITALESASLDVGAEIGNSMTMEAWIRPAVDQLGAGQPILEYGREPGMSPGGPVQGYLGAHLWQLPYDSLWGHVVPRDFSSDKRVIAPPTPFLAGQWYHVAMVYDGDLGTTLLYVDGALVAQRPLEPPYAFATASDLLIGARVYPFNDRFSGTMDEVRIWAHALTAAEIDEQYTRADSLCTSLMTAPPTATATRFIHTDHLGSIIATTSLTGEILCREEYGPFGETTGGGCEKGRFNGRDHEPDMGIYNYWSRYYHPGSARFLTADSYAGSLGDSQSRNRYAYVMNNPMAYTDPTGNFACSGDAGYDDIFDQKAYERCGHSGGKDSPFDQFHALQWAVQGAHQQAMAQRAAEAAEAFWREVRAELEANQLAADIDYASRMGWLEDGLPQAEFMIADVSAGVEVPGHGPVQGVFEVTDAGELKYGVKISVDAVVAKGYFKFSGHSSLTDFMLNIFNFTEAVQEHNINSFNSRYDGSTDYSGGWVIGNGNTPAPRFICPPGYTCTKN